MRNPILKYGSLLVGLMAAAIIILSQCYSLDFSESKSKPQPAADIQTEPSSDEGAAFTIAATSFPASAQINFFQEASCLFEILFGNETEIPFHEAIGISLNKFFNVILRVIISPNAP